MSYTSEILARSPAGYYLFDEASGNPQDSSGNARHMDATGGAGSATYQQPGPIYSDPTNYAITFNSPFGFERDAGTWGISDTFTLMCWIKRSALASHTLITSTNQGQGIYLFSNLLTLAKEGVGNLVQATTTITDTTTWHFVAATKATTTMKLYLDAVDVTGTPSDSPFGTPALVGYLGQEGGGTTAFQGTMARPAVFPTALTAGDITTLYNAAAAAASMQAPAEFPARKFGPF
jgi:hypothetical protein